MLLLEAEKMKGAEIDEDRTDNALLEYGADLYSPKSIKVLPPLPTARRSKYLICINQK